MKIVHQFVCKDDSRPAVLAFLRQCIPGSPSWSTVRRMMSGRRVSIGGVLCIDEGRRLAPGEQVIVYDGALPEPPGENDVQVLHVDPDFVIVEKPSGMITLRRSNELSRPLAVRLQQPTLDECVPRLIRRHAARRHGSRRIKPRLPKLYSVHRIDRDSSGLLMFARNEQAQKHLIEQFAQHKAVRRYLALIPGQLPDQTIRSMLIRDRGDGLRGSTTEPGIGQEAITHIRTLKQIGSYSELDCRLETGRTNQIRIHLAESGHPICGDMKYRGPYGEPEIVDESNCPRLALHAAVLEFTHPQTGQKMHFETPWPQDMQRYLNRLQAKSGH